ADARTSAGDHRCLAPEIESDFVAHGGGVFARTVPVRPGSALLNPAEMVLDQMLEPFGRALD
ncbi:MAG TPA: hypothetical protein VGE67_04370, partial [Haloferula sp.]